MMTRKELLDLAARAWGPDSPLDTFYDKYGRYNGEQNDGLAAFVVRELGECHDETRNDRDQCLDAIGLLETAVRELQGVIDVLYKRAEQLE